jgi:molecular chaperone DnaK
MTKPVLGIDLGTTHCVASIYQNGQADVLSLALDGGCLMPSMIAFQESQVLCIGEKAKALCGEAGVRVLSSMKRWMGRTEAEVATEEVPWATRTGVLGNTQICLTVGDQCYSPVELSALLLKELKRRVEASCGPMEEVVITVPAYFNDAQRFATRLAGKLAGFRVRRLLSEPTAAALAYGLDRTEKATVAVFDLGGGTFDLSILKLRAGVFDVVATKGHTAFGGDEFDTWIAQQMRAMDTSASWQVLMHEAETLKRALTEGTQASVSLPNGALFTLTLEVFEKAVEELLDHSLSHLIQEALTDAGLELESLDEVVLVGGSTRVPKVRAWAESLFKRPLRHALNPDEVVARGAAIHGAVLSGALTGANAPLLLDVIPLSLGIETYGGVMTTVIPRNTKLPTKARESMTTFVDGQTSVFIHILQGERKEAHLNRSLASVRLNGISPEVAGAPRLEVTFEVDVDGILSVRAKDLKSDIEQVVEVCPTEGLTEEEVEKMLEASSQYAKADQAHQATVEARQEAERVGRATRKALNEVGPLLEVQVCGHIEGLLTDLEKCAEKADLVGTRRKLGELNQATRGLAELWIKETMRQHSEH